MFARLRQFARGLLFLPDQTITAEQQILQDLAEANSSGMVTTRSQEHTTGDNGIVEALTVNTPNGQIMKRKIDDREERTPSPSIGKKRRVSQDKDDVVAGDTGVSNGSLKEKTTNNSSHQAPIFLDGIDISIPSINSGPKQHIPESQRPMAKAHTLGIVNQPQGSETDTAYENNGETSQGNGVQHQSNTSRKRKNTKPTHSSINGELRTATSSSTNLTDRQKENRPDMKKPTHNRFGSEEPSIASNRSLLQDAQISSLDTAMRDADASGNASDSGDDVPEVISASAALNQTRSAAAEAARAVEIQSLAKKEKRQKRDAHLKEQAATAKKHRKPHVIESSSPGEAAQLANDNQDTHIDANVTRTQPKAKNGFKRNGPLPDLLPDEILATEPPVRLPTPPPIVISTFSKKQRFIDTDPKPPKDIKKGAIKVRVLENSGTVLPPRASKASKNLKESWLAGERGRKSVIPQRRKTGGGFLRA